jgi:hypothetical protein
MPVRKVTRQILHEVEVNPLAACVGARKLLPEIQIWRGDGAGEPVVTKEKVEFNRDGGRSPASRRCPNR